MSREQTAIVPELAAYIRQVALREPEALRQLREEPHPRISMETSPEQGQFLHLLAKLAGARKTLDIGVFRGYSSAWVALAMPPGGRVIACDRSEEFAAIARRTWEAVGVQDKVTLRLGPAAETLQDLLAHGQGGTFDMVYIDADKAGYQTYFELALDLLRTGGLIAVDNVLWGGAIIDPNDDSADTQALRAFNERLHSDQRVALSLIPIGDGLTLACKL